MNMPNPTDRHKYNEPPLLLHFFLHGYADGRPRTATNPQHNIPTLIFKPIYVLSGLSHILYNILTSRLLDFHIHQLANWHRKYTPSPPCNGRTTTALVPFDSYINWAQCFPKIRISTLNPSISTIISTQQLTCTIQHRTSTAAITSKLIVVARPTLFHPFNRVILHNFRVLNLCPRRIWQCEGTKTTSFFEPIHKK